MILASVQTSADRVPFHAYAEGVGIFLAAVTVYLGVCWLITPRLRRHVQRALGNGDAQVRAFVAEVEAWDAEQTALARRVR